MQISKNAEMVLERRYLIKNEKGEPVETVEGLFRRVASAVAAADAHFDEKADVKQSEKVFYDMMTNLPNPDECRPPARPAFRLFCTSS